MVAKCFLLVALLIQGAEEQTLLLPFVFDVAKTDPKLEVESKEEHQIVLTGG